MSHYHYNCDEYCEDCLPVPPTHRDVDTDYGEQDSPAHCCDCGAPLDYTLTSDGVNYVLGKLRDTLRQPAAERNEIARHPNPDNYYNGSRYVEVTRDWATALSSYILPDRDERLIEAFLRRTTAPKTARQYTRSGAD